MLGEKSDWDNLRDKCLSLKKYSLNTNEGKYFENWILRLLKVIDKFIETFVGKVDKVFWNKCFDSARRESGPSSIFHI